MHVLRWSPSHRFLDDTVDVWKSLEIAEQGSFFCATNGIKLFLRLDLDFWVFGNRKNQRQKHICSSCIC